MEGQKIENIRINPDDAEDVVCEKCGSRYFKEVYIIKKFNKLLIGSDRDQIMPVNILACAECGHINDEFQIKESTKKNNSSLIV